MRLTWASWTSSGWSRARNSSCASSAVAFAGMSPIRLATRSTWRSTGMSGRPKQKRSTIEAVFLPIPSMLVNQSRAWIAGISPRNSRE
jgi:hypothetical protein